jgi:hypothetical protein
MDTILGIASGITSTIEFLAVCIVLMLALTLAFVIVVSLLPKDNPLYGLLSEFTRSLTTTAAMAVVAPVAEIFPGIDLAFDAGGIMMFIYVWGKFFRNQVFAARTPRQPKSLPTIELKLPSTQFEYEEF